MQGCKSACLRGGRRARVRACVCARASEGAGGRRGGACMRARVSKGAGECAGVRAGVHE